jgi:hypothetical protein
MSVQLPKVRIIKNRHGSAKAALDRFLAGPLWGNPIQMGPDKFHVYGAWRGVWRRVDVEFTTNRIVVMNHPG